MKTELPILTEDLKECCFEMCKDLKVLKDRLRGLIENHPAMTAISNPGSLYLTPDNPLRNAYRSYGALEDARMRLGKVVQALDGGKSVYKKVN